jgi:aspartate aminotransferase
VAAEAALNGDQGCITPMVKAFRERHVFVVNELNKIPGLSCIMAGGAFYAFPDARRAIATLHQKGIITAATDIALSEYLLVEAGVAVVPGSAFGSEGYIRLSFATSMANLQEALKRIAKALA